MTRLVYAEIFKLRKRLLTKVLAGLILLIFVGGQFPRWQATEAEEFADATFRAEQAVRRLTFLEQTVSENLEVVRFAGLVLGVMFVAGAVGSEYTWGTLRPFLTCAESRAKYLGAKFAALGILIFLGLAGAMLAAIVTSLAIALGRGGIELDFLDGAYVRDALFDFGRTLYVLAPYLLIAALAALAGRSAMIGAAVGLILLAVEGGVTAALEQADNWARHIPDFLLMRNGDAVLGASGQVVESGYRGGEFFEEIVRPPDPWLGALVLAVYAVGALALALAVFHRRDVTA